MSLLRNAERPIQFLHQLAIEDPATACAPAACYIVGRSSDGRDFVLAHIHDDDAGEHRTTKAIDLFEIHMATGEAVYEKHVGPWLREVHPELQYQELAPLLEAGLQEVA